mgnify:FL=1
MAEPTIDIATDLAASAPARPIVVLGMHRSGTSAIAKTLLGLGAWMGSEQFVTRRTEHALVQDCNQRLLNGHGGHWSAAPELVDGWVSDPASSDVVADARVALRDLAGHGPAAWKDPRNAFTLPFWRSLLGGDPVAIIVYRHPLEVAASLAKRNDFGIGHSVALWEQYNRALLVSAAGLPVTSVAYSALALDPIRTLTAVRESLTEFGVDLPGTASDAASDVESDRRHHVFDTLPDEIVTPQQRALWGALCGLAPHDEHFTTPDLPEVHPASRELLAERRAAIAARRDADERATELRSRRALLRRLVGKSGRDA